MRNIAVFLIAASSLALGAEVSHTELMDFPPGGTLRLHNSTGEVTVEGWDQSSIEITTIKSAKTVAQGDRVHFVTVRNGQEILVATESPKHRILAVPFRAIEVSVQYRIKAPANAHVTIEHNIGEVHIIGTTGDIHVTDHMGQITVQLPQDGQYSIDAKSKLGAIDSDFPGDEHRKHKFGHSFINQAPSASQKLYLRIGFGDITILAERRPPVPALAQE